MSFRDVRDGVDRAFQASRRSVLSKLTHSVIAPHLAILLAVGGGLGALSAPVFAQTLDARTGAWEMKVAATMEGMGVQPEALAKLPPAKRGEVEKMVADQAGKRPVSTVRSCVRKEDLAQARFMQNDDPKCTVETTTRTATRLVATRTCQGPPPSTATLRFDAQSPQHVAGTIEQQRADGGKLNVEIDGRWLSASCDGIPPVPQKAR